MTAFQIRLADPQDAFAMSQLGTENYPENYYERQEVFLSRLEGAPDSCWVATLENTCAGYLVAFSYLSGLVCPLDELFIPVAQPDCFYIHDLCVGRAWRKSGLGRELAYVALQRAGELGFARTALVAVLDSHGFWKRLGFRVVREIQYAGSPAAYMIREYL